MGTAGDVFTATGETLAQIQDRVLGAGVSSSSLYTAIPGYATGGIRADWRAGRHQVIVDVENLNDKNYRGVSWGIAPRYRRDPVARTCSHPTPTPSRPP